MGTGESEAAVRGAAAAIAATGHDVASSMARLTEEAAAAQERIVADVEAADREAAERLAATSNDAETVAVAAGVPGPARGKSLRMPNPRHTVRGARYGEIRPRNTVILNGYEQAVREDVEGIAAGRAVLNDDGSAYLINGRSYGVESSGTVYPISGKWIGSTRSQRVRRAQGDRQG